MKKRFEIVFMIIILVSVLLMILYAISSSSHHVKDYEPERITLNQSQKQFIKQNKRVELSVSPELSYLGEGFLRDYLNSILVTTSLNVKLSPEGSDKTKGRICTIDGKYGKKTDRARLTAPLFELKASMFVLKEQNTVEDHRIKGIIVKGLLSSKEKSRLSYNDQSIELEEVDSTGEAVARAKAGTIDCIIGYQPAVVFELKRQGLIDRYQDSGAPLATKNVCIAVNEREEELYHILNQSVHSADRHLLMMQAQERWYGIPSSFVEEDRCSDAAILLIIVFAAVFCAFFFYYQSNKNLYNELTERMNQLIASKQEMQTTFNGVSYYMAELNSEGVIIDINQAFLEYIKKEPMGKHIEDVLELPEEWDGILKESIQQTIVSRKGVSKEVKLKRQIMEINIFPIIDRAGIVDKLLFMASDVTGERMAERQLLQDNKMIAIGQLAAGVAHEIRNPLGLIGSYCYILKNVEDRSKKAQAVQMIEKSVDTSNQIIDNLLNFSRASKHQLRQVNIREHTDSVLSLNRGMLKKKQIRIDIICSEDFPVLIPIESFDMVLINLISNAVDAVGEHGEIKITIQSFDHEFTVEVVDTGHGIENEIMNEIFNPFFTTKGHTKGNGLGLYIVYNEIQKMNGSIEVSSEPGNGTSFRISIPHQIEEATDA